MSGSSSAGTTFGAAAGGTPSTTPRSTDDRSTFEHVLRRTTFGPFPGAVDAAMERHRRPLDLVEEIVEAPIAPFAPVLNSPDLPDGGRLDPASLPPDSDLRFYRSFSPWWIEQMSSDSAGLRDKLMWFWHTHFTSSFVKVDSTEMCWSQMQQLHAHALGNFGELVRSLLRDRAMLRYLDGDGSSAESPNENLARELMELFTLGVDTYSQRDVVAAARVLAGWRIDSASTLRYDDSARLDRPVEVLGGSVSDVDDLVDRLLDHDACASFVVGRLAAHLLGSVGRDTPVASWARLLRRRNYELAPVVSAILRSDEFMSSRGRRARTPVEWYSATSRAFNSGNRTPAHLVELGQAPYDPPNPAGWPGDASWLSATHVHAKVRVVSSLDASLDDDLVSSDDIVAAALHRCSLSDASDVEREVLARLAEQLAYDPEIEPTTRARSVLSATVLSPSFTLS